MKEVNLGMRSPWTLQKFTNCESTHVIYMLVCPCQLMYIGMTTRKVKIRVSEHRSTFRCKQSNTKLTRHYMEKNHGEDDLKWCVIDKLDKNDPNVTKRLFRYEQRWIYRLKTHRFGLHDDIQWNLIM